LSLLKNVIGAEFSAELLSNRHDEMRPVLRKNDWPDLKSAEFLANLRGERQRGPPFIMSTWLSWLKILGDLVHFLSLSLRPRDSLAAENLFLRKQLAFYQERQIKPRRTDNPTRLTLVLLSRWFDWRNALTVVKPKTFTGWHRQGFRLFWRWQSRAGRRPIPRDLQRLIRQLADQNFSWGEERIANELLLKLGLRVSPRTIRKYLPKLPATPPGQARGDQRWSTFLRNHAQSIVACDFCVTVTATFRILYVLVVIEHASRRLLHLNTTGHPSAAWTLQQLRETISSDHPYRFIIHDRDAIFSADFDTALANLGLTVIKTPVRSPQANALCERVIGTLRRECMDWIIPLSEGHLRQTLRSWMAHYNRGRPHSSLGPGIPEPSSNLPVALQRQRHRFDRPTSVVARSILNGLHHEYRPIAHAA
jgi:putative transposase